MLSPDLIQSAAEVAAITVVPPIAIETVGSNLIRSHLPETVKGSLTRIAVRGLVMLGSGAAAVANINTDPATAIGAATLAATMGNGIVQEIRHWPVENPEGGKINSYNALVQDARADERHSREALTKMEQEEGTDRTSREYLGTVQWHKVTTDFARAVQSPLPWRQKHAYKLLIGQRDMRERQLTLKNMGVYTDGEPQGIDSFGKPGEMNVADNATLSKNAEWYDNAAKLVARRFHIKYEPYKDPAQVNEGVVEVQYGDQKRVVPYRSRTRGK